MAMSSASCVRERNHLPAMRTSSFGLRPEPAAMALSSAGAPPPGHGRQARRTPHRPPGAIDATDPQELTITHLSGPAYESPPTPRTSRRFLWKQALALLPLWSRAAVPTQPRRRRGWPSDSPPGVAHSIGIGSRSNSVSPKRMHMVPLWRSTRWTTSTTCSPGCTAVSIRILLSFRSTRDALGSASTSKTRTPRPLAQQ